MNLFTVMIVDDERIIREGIEKQVSWEKHGMKIVKSTSNALDALKFMEKEIPDIIISDIRMPVMDGLEFIEKAKEITEESIFVLLSGYQDFNYAQKAIRLGVRDYLLKPTNEEKILETMEKIKEELKQKKTEREFLNKTKKDIKDVSMILKDISGFTTRGTEREMDFLEVTERIKKHLQELDYQKKKKFSKAVKAIISIVEKEIGNERLSLKWISKEKLFLNENYLSKLFLKETGKRFSKYLMDERMGRALKLLEERDETRICEIAEEIGYGKNPRYFGMAFKKYTGLTPSEYKNIITK